MALPGPKLLRIMDMMRSPIDWSTVPRCEISKEDEQRFLLHHGDIVVARTGQGSVGSARFIGSPPRSAFASYLVRFRIREDHCARYVGYVVEGPDYERFVRANAGGASRPSASAPVLASYPVPTPPLETQRKIAAVLAAYDELIENNLRRIEILEEMAQAVYREWFVNFRFPGHKNVPLVDSALGPIPEGWKYQSFSDLASYVNGFAFRSKEHWHATGKPIVKIKELKNGVTDETPRYYGGDIKEKYHIDDGDLLFSWSADLDAYLWRGGPALLNQHLFNVLPEPGIDRLWLFEALRAAMPRFRALSGGTTMKHIKRSALSEVFVPRPMDDVQQGYVSEVRPIVELVQDLIRQNANLRSTRDLLLPKLVSGEVDVSDLDIDTEWLAL